MTTLIKRETDDVPDEPKLLGEPDPDDGDEDEPEAKAVEAAVAEVNDDDLHVAFRGTEFIIPRKTLTSARFLLAFKTNELHTLLFELLGSANAGAFIEACQPGESLGEVATEFFTALNKETGQGNS